MPILGETRKDVEIGLYKGYQTYVWSACLACGKERWVRVIRGKPLTEYCTCVRKLSEYNVHGVRWKGGQFSDGKYVFIYAPNHPKTNHKKYVKKARLVLEEKLGRYLRDGCEAHHINEIKDDDRPENLEELSHSEHTTLHQNRRWQATRAEKF